MTRSIKFYFGAVVLAFVCAGCASTRINKVSAQDLSMPVAEAVRHSKDVMNDHGFDIQVIDREDGSARLEGEHVDGQDVEIDITPISAESAHVKIQVTNEPPRVPAKAILDDIAVRYE